MSVTLTVELRDSIRETVGYLVAGTLGPGHHDVEPLDRVPVVELAAHLATSIRVLDALGWDKRPDRESYELDADPAVLRLMSTSSRATRSVAATRSGRRSRKPL